MGQKDYILGISCFYHDAAACLLKDGRIIAAAEEERFTRKKHDSEFPENAIKFCLDFAKISANDISYICFYEKPFIKFERILSSYVETFPKSYIAFLKAMPVWLKKKLHIDAIIKDDLGYSKKVLYIDHHFSHAASAFLPSPFEEAAVITMDGVGEWDTAAFGFAKGNEINLLKEIHFPHSLGLLYSAVTSHLGFKVNNDEYKVMGLAPYGKPVYYDKLRDLVDIAPDGSFQLDMRHFAYHYTLENTTRLFKKIFGAPRVYESKIEQKHCDLARSMQVLLEEILLKIAGHVQRETGMENLCMAGGVALNCVANGKIIKQTPFKRLFIQPGAGDSGGAIGAALYLYNTMLKNKRTYVMEHAYLGPEFTREEIKGFLESRDALFSELERDELLREVASFIKNDRIVGWFQGRMEFGPRALGNRSILANPCNPDMKDILNEKIKLREGFRPFAPSVLLDKSGEYFDLGQESPYMLLVGSTSEDKRKVLPSVTHVDGTARIQTVKRESNPLYYDLIKELERQTGVPVTINTSFNIRGEPIVCRPEDAYRCFMKTKIDYLVMGNFLVKKRGS
jgi:carbamoyltransferase